MDIFISKKFYPIFSKHRLQFVDVGASGGVQQHWEKAKRFLNYIAFEPDEREFNKLMQKRNANSRYLKCALDKDRATQKLYITRKQEASSLFRPNRSLIDAFPEPERFDIMGEQIIETDTLDHQLKLANIDGIDFIKIDTQGSELPILKGAEQTLECVFGLEIEAEFVELYEGQPLIFELIQWVYEHGFEVFDVKSTYWKRSKGVKYGKSKGQLIFADILFLRKVHSFDEHYFSTLDDEQQKGKILKALAICLLYGYIDYAIELFNIKENMFTGEENEIFYDFIKHTISLRQKIPNFRGRDRIANTLTGIAGIFERNHWGKSSRFIGNN